MLVKLDDRVDGDSGRMCGAALRGAGGVSPSECIVARRVEGEDCSLCQKQHAHTRTHTRTHTHTHARKQVGERKGSG